ncbi:MAG: MFS transporter [Desulfobaccales bacterium]
MLLSFLISIHAVVIAALYFFLPIYLQGDLFFSGTQIGLLYGVLSLNSLAAAFPVGVLGDRHPTRILTRLGLLGIALSLWGLARAERFWPFLLVFFAFGLSLQLYRQSLDIILFKDQSAGDSHRRFGAYNAWRMAGMTAGILLGGVSLYFLDYPQTFNLLGALLLPLFPLTWRLPATRGQKNPLLQYGRDFLSRPVLFFVTWLFLFTMHWGAEGTSLGLFLKKNLGLGPLGVGLYLAGEFSVIALSVYLWGRFGAGRLSPFTLLALSLAASGAGHIFMTYPLLAWSFAWRAVHGVGDGLIMMITYTTIAQLFHVDRIGGNAGLISLATTFGVLSGSLIYGPLGASWGYQMPLILSGLTSFALIPLAYVGLKR